MLVTSEYPMLNIIMTIAFYIVMAIMLISFYWYAVAKHVKWTKKYIAAFDNGSDYELIGLYGISEKHIKHKINKLRKQGCTIDTRWGNNRFVDYFPDYCTCIL